MDRRSLSVRWRTVVWSLALLSLLIGCKSALQSFTILYEGGDSPADCDVLKGKKVAVVCKPLSSLEFNNSGADRALAEGVCDLLKAHVKGIQIIDPQKVDRLRDEKGMEDYVEIGKALGADKVVGIDIESFGVLDGQTLYRGRSTLSIRVYDVTEKHVEWRKSPPSFEYPKTCSTPAADFTETEFRNRFVAILAEQIARFFYQHDPKDDYGGDALSIR